MHYLSSLNIYIKNHQVKSPQNIKLTLACQEILEPNVILEPILNYNVKLQSYQRTNEILYFPV